MNEYEWRALAAAVWGAIIGAFLGLILVHWVI